MGSQSYILPSLSASPMVLVTPVASRSTRWCWRRGAAAGNVKRSACRSWGRSSPRLCWTTRTVSSAEDPMPEGLPDWGLTPRSHPGLGWTPWGWEALPGQMLNPPTQYFPAQDLALGDEGQPPPSPAPTRDAAEPRGRSQRAPGVQGVLSRPVLHVLLRI